MTNETPYRADCKCPCHTGGGVMHVMPCCQPGTPAQDLRSALEPFAKWADWFDGMYAPDDRAAHGRGNLDGNPNEYILVGDLRRARDLFLALAQPAENARGGEVVARRDIRRLAQAAADLTVPEDAKVGGPCTYKRMWYIARDAALAALEAHPPAVRPIILTPTSADAFEPPAAEPVGLREALERIVEATKYVPNEYATEANGIARQALAAIKPADATPAGEEKMRRTLEFIRDTDASAKFLREAAKTTLDALATPPALDEGEAK